MPLSVFVIAVLVSMQFLSLPAQAAGLQACATRHIPKAELVGEGRLSVLAWDIYDAQLFAPKGQLTKQAPFALKLSYLRDVKSDAIVKTTIDEISRQGFKDKNRLQRWQQKLSRIYPDVKKGSTLIGVRTAKGTTVFCAADREIGRIDDPEFTKHFFNIWLGDKTKSPDLRRRLLGQTS